jgi:hypothetical protein
VLGTFKRKPSVAVGVVGVLLDAGDLRREPSVAVGIGEHRCSGVGVEDTLG